MKTAWVHDGKNWRKNSVMVRLVAGLDGYVACGSEVLPLGVETVWKGLSRMRDLARKPGDLRSGKTTTVTTCVI